MIKTFKKLWSIVDIFTDMIVDVVQAISRELREGASPTEAVDKVKTNLEALLTELQDPATSAERKEAIISSLRK